MDRDLRLWRRHRERKRIEREIGKRGFSILSVVGICLSACVCRLLWVYVCTCFLLIFMSIPSPSFNPLHEWLSPSPSLSIVVYSLSPHPSQSLSAARSISGSCVLWVPVRRCRRPVSIFLWDCLTVFWEVMKKAKKIMFDLFRFLRQSRRRHCAWVPVCVFSVTVQLCTCLLLHQSLFLYCGSVHLLSWASPLSMILSPAICV